MPPGLLEGDEYAEVSEAFAAKDAARLAEILDSMVEESSEADAALVRRRFFRTLLSFARAQILAGKLPRYQAFRNVEFVEEAYRRCEKSMKSEPVLSYLLDRFAF